MMSVLERTLEFGMATMLLLSPASPANAQTALQAHLESTQTEWVLGVPVEFTVSVRNISNRTVRTRLTLYPEDGYLSFLISEDGSNFHRYTGSYNWGETIDMIPGLVTLKPGQAEQAAFSVLWDLPIGPARHHPMKGFAFLHPGTYFVEVRILVCDVGDLTSNVVRIVVLEPHGEDVGVWEALKADKELALYYGYPRPGGAVQAVVERLQKLLYRYPHSSHTAAMRKALDVYAKHKAEMEKLRNSGQVPPEQK
jgi:hypothetical protein